MIMNLIDGIGGAFLFSDKKRSEERGVPIFLMDYSGSSSANKTSN